MVKVACVSATTKTDVLEVGVRAQSEKRVVKSKIDALPVGYNDTGCLALEDRQRWSIWSEVDILFSRDMPEEVSSKHGTSAVENPRRKHEKCFCGGKYFPMSLMTKLTLTFTLNDPQDDA